ncbi:type II toxin-antitoxin system tRNA(fMet)-specific endonuclease VapC [Nostoc sp. MG11]|uniref:type II toxin-antitoxin system tRNA(fMet)-specific endonuclease VapC n=1 Tax=Nostoc sp. MG11 TaxID=2721166 RepID=UPI00186807DA|nr:type II toxin-antitoxin system VapC family toxin [Nostoc sp. MG11]
MRYLLDTNVCARYLNGRSPVIRERLRSTNVEDIAVCSVVKAELFYGAMRSNDPARTLARQQEFLKLFVSLPFDDSTALVYGRIRAELLTSGTPIGPNDFQIAAIALTNNLTLVTHNTREFNRVSELVIEDWELEQ